MTDEILDITNLDELETQSSDGPGSFICKARVDVGFKGFLSGVSQQDSFFSLKKYGGKEGAERAVRAAHAEQNNPLERPPTYQFLLAMYATTVKNRDEPTWKGGERWFIVEIRSSNSDELKRGADEGNFVPFAYEGGIKPMLDDLLKVAGAKKVAEIFDTEFWMEIIMQPDPWELRQIERAAEGKRVWRKYEDMEPDDVNWVPVIKRVFANEEEATAAAGGDASTQRVIPNEPDAWVTKDHGQWASYFSTMYSAARQGSDTVEELSSFKFDDNDGVPVVTEEHLEQVLSYSEEAREEEIPF